MKCQLCKYLNTREEARKHLNNDSLRSLENAFKQLAIPMETLKIALKKCNIHVDYAVAADHLINAGNLSDEAANLLIPGSHKIFAPVLQALLNRYPDPRKVLDN